MRAVIQRVKRASVSVGSEVAGEIGEGLLVFLGIAQGDTLEKVDWLVKKIVNMRIFADQDGKMNLSAIDRNLELLAISQFTLLADCAKGNRPNFMGAARPEEAIPLYESFIRKASEHLPVKQGVFGAMMDIDLVNDGPVTIVIEV